MSNVRSNVRKTSTWLALGLALAGCGSKKPIEQAPQAVQTKRISSDPTAANGALRFSAVVEPDARVPVSFRIPGYVTAIKQTRGEGDAQRNRIFADAYGKDPDFFSFYRSMQAYETGLRPNDTRMVLRPDSDFFKYFGDPSGKATSGTSSAPATVRTACWLRSKSCPRHCF